MKREAGRPERPVMRHRVSGCSVPQPPPCAAQHADTGEFTGVSRCPYLSETRPISHRPVPSINA
jgi:hypothetical protein